MEETLRKILLIAAVLFLFSGRDARSEWTGNNDPMNPLMLGVSGGYGMLSGYYDATLTGAYSLGVFIIPYAGEFLMGEADMTFARYGIRNTESSSLMSFSANIGPVLYYSPWSFFRVYASVSFRGSVFHIDARNTGKQDSTFKAGFSFGTGFYIPVMQKIQARFSYRFSENDLSDRAFMSHEFSMGMVYSFGRAGINGREGKIPYSELKGHYDEGVARFEEGDFASAGDSFQKVLALDSGHRDAQNYLRIIGESEKAYGEARVLMERRDYYGAITILESIHPKMNAARESLAGVRQLLADRVEGMEGQCVKAYDDKNYEMCIAVCRKLLLIDRENQIAGLYLERAEKRLRTMRKLK